MPDKDNNPMIDYVGRYTRVSIGSSFTSGSGSFNSGYALSLLALASQRWAHYCLPQMHKEGVEFTEYEKDFVRLTNIDSRYGYLSITHKLLQPISFEHTDTLLRCQREITEKIFKMIFPRLISITITRTPKMRETVNISHSIPFHQH